MLAVDQLAAQSPPARLTYSSALYRILQLTGIIFHRAVMKMLPSDLSAHCMTMPFTQMVPIHKSKNLTSPQQAHNNVDYMRNRCQRDPFLPHIRPFVVIPSIKIPFPLDH